MRINKFLAQAGVCSRREADELIRNGKVTINGKVAGLGDQITEEDNVEVEGKKVSKEETEKVYIAFHKPFGVITTTDKTMDNNILDWVDLKTHRIFPVGRLDVQSSGLILLTNDGEIVDKICRSVNQHEKEYLVTVDKSITPEFLKKMAEGVYIFKRKTLPARIQQISPQQFDIVIVQGMNKQIRRMCEGLGYNVEILKRIRIMNIKLGELQRGKWRFLTNGERKDLLRALNLER
ncbi:MAG: pseudouridine synthase [Candidatus Gracilibacteria bacterium]|jgi:23S rRNA pseudouridine2604 synthase